MSLMPIWWRPPDATWIGWSSATRTGPPNLETDLVADDPFWLRLVSDDRLLRLAEAFVGPDIALFASHYVNKPPRSGQPVLWHQDAAYWPLEPMEVVTLWLAVDHSTSANGCLRVIPGSHGEEVHTLRDRSDVANVLGSESSAPVDETAAVDLVLTPGDVEIHHPKLLHASGANRSRHRRCGLAIRYIPTTTRIVTDGGPFVSAFHLRGAPGPNRYRATPTFNPDRHFPIGSWDEAARPGARR